MILGSGIRDPGSGKNLFRIPDPGVKKHPIPDPRSGSATLLSGTGTVIKWNFFGILKVTGESRVGYGSISQRYGSPKPDLHRNVVDPQHWLRVNKL
jgi:hypothetical protein